MVLMLVSKVLADILVVMCTAMTPSWSDTPCVAAQVNVHLLGWLTCLEKWNEAV